MQDENIFAVMKDFFDHAHRVTRQKEVENCKKVILQLHGTVGKKAQMWESSFGSPMHRGQRNCYVMQA